MKEPSIPSGYTRVPFNDKIRHRDQFWNWQDGRFEIATYLVGQECGDPAERYIIREIVKLKPKSISWSKKLALLAVKEK